MVKSLGKILLYNSINQSFFPSGVDPINLGILAISSVLKASGYDTVLIPNIDLPSSQKLLKKELKTALLVGVSCMTGDPILNGIKFSKFVKKLRPNIPICWGGYHVTMDFHNSIREKFIDYIVRGQGERTVVELVSAIKKKSGFSRILGLVYKKNGKTVINPARPTEAIDSFPPFDYQLYFDKFNSVGYEQLTYCSSRGCPFECTFCSVSNFYNKGYLTYSTPRFLSDIKDIVTKYNPKSVFFWDDNFFVNLKRVNAFLDDYLKNKYTFSWLTFSRCGTFATEDKVLLNRLKQCNCSCILFGAESGSPRILKYIKKHMDPAEVTSSCKVVSKYGIIPDYTFISGFPTETVDDLNMTLNLIKKLNKINPDSGVRLFSFNLSPGIPILADCAKFGFIPPSTMGEWSKYEFHSFIAPWITRHHQNLLKSVVWITSYVSPNTVPHSGRWYIDVILSLLHFDALWRIRHNFYSFSPEWRLYYEIYRRHYTFSAADGVRKI